MIIVVISIHDSVNGGFFSMGMFEDFQRWQGSAWVLVCNAPQLLASLTSGDLLLLS